MLKIILSKIDKLIAIIIKGVIFFLPLFFLPWTSEYFEFNKQFFLWLAMSLALLLWLIRQVVAGEIKIKTNPLNLPIIIFLALTGASALFSLDVFSSFFGSDGRFSDAWLGLLSLAVFYFLLINAGLVSSALKIFVLLKLLFYAAFISAVISLLAMFGLTQWLMADPFNILASPWFNPTGGSALSLTVFLAVMSVAAAGFLSSGGLNRLNNFIFSIGLILFLLILALVNFYLSWLILVLGAGFLIVSRFLRFGLNSFKNYYWLIPPALMIVAVFFLAPPKVNPAKLVLGRPAAKEALLDFKTSALITKKALAVKPILGSGPATFSQDFSLYRPAEFNQSDYWQIRFDKSASHFLEMAATAGLPAVLSYFLIISLIIYINIILFMKYLKNRPSFLDSEEYNLIAVIFTVFVLLSAAQLFFPVNTVLNFSFWLFAALMVAFWQSHNQALFKEKIININKTVLFFRVFLVGLFFLGALCLAFAGFAIKSFAAEVAAASSSNREAGWRLAAKLNPARANYNISLAKFYLERAQLEAAKPAAEKDNNFIQSNISRAIRAGRLAATAASNSVKAHETLAMIYRDIRPLTTGSEVWAVRFFQNAFNLEPTNPILAVELAKAYLNNNDAANAAKYFIRASELKPGYYEAEFGLAKAYLRNKKDDSALKLLNNLAAKVVDQEVFYELGRFYYNHGEIDKAIDRFKLALSLSPKHSNSLYSLAAAYETKGEVKTALKYYRQVLELNQGNKEVEKKIKELEK